MQFNLDYFYGNETSQFRFYRVPKDLFDGDISLEAVTLYGMMLDRVGLSAKNGWVDNLGRVFIYFVQKDVQKFLRCGHNRATAFMRELERFGLIERKRQGLGKPAMIYVKNFSSCKTVPEENSVNEAAETVQTENTHDKALFSAPERAVKAARTRQSRVPAEGSLDCPDQAPNETEEKEPELIETNHILPQPLAVTSSASLASPQAAKLTRCAAPALPTANVAQTLAALLPYGCGVPLARTSLVCGGAPKGRNLMDEVRWVREEIRENIDYEGLIWDHPCDADIFCGYVELMTEAACSAKETVRICGQDIPTALVRSRFLKLERKHVEYVRDCLCHATTAIGNIKAYTLAALYNAPVTCEQYYAALVSRDMTNKDL